MNRPDKHIDVEALTPNSTGGTLAVKRKDAVADAASDGGSPASHDKLIHS